MMALFNLRLSSEQQRRLQTEADDRGITRSDVTREALELYFRSLDQRARLSEDIQDDWSDFGAKVIAAQKAALKAAIDQLDDMPWSETIEATYAAFKERTVEKTRCYTNPAIFTKNREAPYGAKVVAALGFATDDCYEISVDLEQLFFEYAWHAGDEAFNEIPGIWERAKARVDAGEAHPSRDDEIEARTFRG